MGKKSYDELDELEKLRWDFWNTLRQHLLEARSFLRPGDSEYGYWLLFKLGVADQGEATGQHVRIEWDDSADECRSYHVEVTYYGQPLPPLTSGPYDPAMSRKWLDFMLGRRQEIHGQLGFKLEWDDHSPIEIYLRSRRVIADIRNLDAWPGYINDMRIQAEHLHNVFQPHALAFNEAH